jgi:hypothetical protein
MEPPDISGSVEPEEEDSQIAVPRLPDRSKGKKVFFKDQ